jgi:hypothetical protein
MSQISQITIAKRRDSCHELETRTTATPRPEDRLLFAIERMNHTFHLDSYKLSGTAKEKLSGLKKRRTAELGTRQLIAAYLLCKRPYIAIGAFGVCEFRAPSKSTW